MPAAKDRVKTPKEAEASRVEDAVAVYNCPRHPSARVLVYGETFATFRNGTLHANEEEADAIRRAENDDYIPADPAFADEPFTCDECGSLWHSKRAFQLHVKLSHTN